MKIAIIGGGWSGCHLAMKLKSSHDITIYEQSELFSGASFYNQNRLHNGFHYSRNSSTRKLCYTTFQLFLNDYAHLVNNVKNNYYVVPKYKSLIDFETFKNIFKYENLQFEEVSIDFLSDIEGCITVNEKYIDPLKTKKFFTESLGEYVVKRNVDIEFLNVLSESHDLVIDATNNSLSLFPDHYYELSLTLVYSNINELKFGAMTMVDGELFSIYPYRSGEYTLTDVQYTPIYTDTDINNIYKFKNDINIEFVHTVKSKIEAKVCKYYNEFNSHFKFKNYYTSIKVKRNSESADRSPTIQKNGNIITCVTGKIQGIYTLENYIKNEIISR